jgi:hypothetical protein
VERLDSLIFSFVFCLMKTKCFTIISFLYHVHRVHCHVRPRLEAQPHRLYRRSVDGLLGINFGLFKLVNKNAKAVLFYLKVIRKMISLIVPEEKTIFCALFIWIKAWTQTESIGTRRVDFVNICI